MFGLRAIFMGSVACDGISKVEKNGGEKDFKKPTVSRLAQNPAAGKAQRRLGQPCCTLALQSYILPA